MRDISVFQTHTRKKKVKGHQVISFQSLFLRDPKRNLYLKGIFHTLYASPPFRKNNWRSWTSLLLKGKKMIIPACLRLSGIFFCSGKALPALFPSESCQYHLWATSVVATCKPQSWKNALKRRGARVQNEKSKGVGRARRGRASQSAR